MNIPNLSTSHQGPFSSFLDVCVLYAIGEEIGMADCCCPHPFSFFSFRFDSGRRECKKMGQSRDFFFFRNDATVNRATLSPPTHTHTHKDNYRAHGCSPMCLTRNDLSPVAFILRGWTGGGGSLSAGSHFVHVHNKPTVAVSSSVCTFLIM